MDHERFDSLTRALVANTSRRKVLKLLGATIITSLAGPLFSKPKPAMARPGTCSREGLEQCLQHAEFAYNTCLSGCNFVEPRERKICKSTCRRTYKIDVNLCREQGCPTGQICCGGACISECDSCSACDDTMGSCKSNCGECHECGVLGLCRNKCKACERCQGGTCVPVGSTSSEGITATTLSSSTPCGDQCCGPCQVCDNGTCRNCNACETCENDTCVPIAGGEPCGNACCGPCETCQNGVCMSTCSSCEICQDGTCVPRCDPCETCQDGTCQSICGPCEICQDGTCVPTLCPNCQACDTATGTCVDVCSAGPPGFSCCPGTDISGRPVFICCPPDTPKCCNFQNGAPICIPAGQPCPPG
jgi:hypothetical protein